MFGLIMTEYFLQYKRTLRFIKVAVKWESRGIKLWLVCAQLQMVPVRTSISNLATMFTPG
jgi:hypothetical protein